MSHLPQLTFFNHITIFEGLLLLNQDFCDFIWRNCSCFGFVNGFSKYFLTVFVPNVSRDGSPEFHPIHDLLQECFHCIRSDRDLIKSNICHVTSAVIFELTSNNCDCQYFDRVQTHWVTTQSKINVLKAINSHDVISVFRHELIIIANIQYLQFPQTHK